MKAKLEFDLSDECESEELRLSLHAEDLAGVIHDFDQWLSERSNPHSVSPLECREKLVNLIRVAGVFELFYAV